MGVVGEFFGWISHGFTFFEVLLCVKLKQLLQFFLVPEKWASRLSARVIASLYEVVFIGLFFFVYEIVRMSSQVLWTDEDAKSHSDVIVSIEKALHIFFEKDWQRAVIDQTTFLEILGQYYAYSIWIFTTSFLMITLVFFPRSYGVNRTTVMIATIFAMFTYFGYPVAPPRLVPKYGIEDTNAETLNLNPYGSPNTGKSAFADPNAAFPSMHCGWSLFVCLGTLYALWPYKWYWRVLGVVCTIWHWLLTTYTIIVTGNHWTLDCLGGILYILVCYAAVIALSYFVGFQLRPYDHDNRERQMLRMERTGSYRTPLLDEEQPVLTSSSEEADHY